MLRCGWCPLCGRTDGRIVLHEGGYFGRQCNCGIIFIDPAPPPEAVDARIDYHHRIYYAVPANKRVSWLRKFKERGLVLDVGCGEGEFADAAIQNGFQVEGIEPSAERAELVSTKLGIPVECALIENSQLPNGRYDAVFHVDLLSHFPDPIRSLCAMRDRLKLDGVLCFEVGLFSNLSPFWRNLAGSGNMPAHRWFFDAPAVERLLEASGFRLLDIRRYSIGVSTALSSLLVRLVAPFVLEPGGRPARPIAQGPLSGPYYRLHMMLRYDLGRWLPIGGPQTAFVAAARVP